MKSQSKLLSHVSMALGFCNAFTLGLLLLLISPQAHADPEVVVIHATQDIILADGKSQTVIWADVRDPNGRPVNGAAVQFQTTAGILTQTRVTTFNGRAQTTLTSATLPGTAHVTAIAEGAALGVSQVLDIEFTDDPQDTFAGNSFYLITGSYVVYSALDKAIESHGENGTAKITYRNFEVTADRFQLKCDETGILRAANNVVLKRGKNVIHAIHLYYSLDTGEGYAIAVIDGKPQDVEISGEHLITKPLAGKITSSYLTLPTLQNKLIVSARSISFFPGDRLQFRRPHFYQDGLQIMALPYYQMALNSQELFSDHFVSVGSRGLGLEVPYYYDLSPRTSGILFLRHQENLGMGYTTSEPGWSVEMQENYVNNGRLRSEGQYGVTGLLDSDWSLHWNHLQEFNPTTQGSFYIDLPEHNSVFTTASLTQQRKTFRLGLDFSGGDTFFSPVESTLRGDVYAETNPHPLGVIPGMQYVLGTKLALGKAISPDPAVLASAESEGEVTLRAFSRPWQIDRLTSLTGSFTLGQLWSLHDGSGVEGLVTIALNHKLANGGILGLSYDYNTSPIALTDLGGTSRISMVYRFIAGKRFQASLFGSAYLDVVNENLVADMAYRLNSNWRVVMLATVTKASIDTYRDFEFILGRRIGARELQFTYSTFNHRFYLDLSSTQW